MKWLVSIAVAIAILLVGGYLAFRTSPWPAVLVIRHAFDKDTARRNAALARHVPQGVLVLRDQPYGMGENKTFDLYRPRNVSVADALPAIVWVHGGAFVAGDKADVGEYLRILAAAGYTAISVGYTVAPAARYPTPVTEVNEALGFLVTNASMLGIDSSRIVLAGDSAGAQIAAQLAAAISDPAYGKAIGFAPLLDRHALKGVALFCGIYDARQMNMEGAFGDFLRTVLWSYFGDKHIAGDDKRLAQFSVAGHVTSSFPPALLSAGNGDPLEPQSRKLADAIAGKGVRVDTLFFGPDRTPALPHEYQFDLDDRAGREALARLKAFLAALFKD
jgi:acetyl esterase/lipase